MYKACSGLESECSVCVTRLNINAIPIRLEMVGICSRRPPASYRAYLVTEGD